MYQGQNVEKAYGNEVPCSLWKMCWRSKLEKWRFNIGANAMERFYSSELSSPRSSRMLRRNLDFLKAILNGSPALPAIHHETARGRW